MSAWDRKQNQRGAIHVRQNAGLHDASLKQESGWIALHPPGSSPAMHFWQILVQLHAALALSELQPSLAMHFHLSV
jgi:hypothetical protein